MGRFAFSLFLLMFLTSCSAAKPPAVDTTPTPVTVDATLRLEFKDGYCSGTVVAPDIIMTAKHCLTKEAKSFRAGDQIVNIVDSVTDDHDHALIKVTASYKTWASFSGTLPVVGDGVYYWGNAAGLNQMYRRGYVSGIRPDGSAIYDSNSWFGDSGAALFNADGLIVGVVSSLGGDVDHGFVLMASRPFSFTLEDLTKIGMKETKPLQ